ncbi:MAG: hypothetical protein P1P69_04180 [Methanosarcinaceae archaeon]|nr:hypothetical protein [Methanosarcinaceae archaeon]
MKIIGAMFLVVAMSIMLIAGIASLQAQSDVGDTIINESSDNYESYNELKNSTALSMKTAGYGVYLLIIFVLAVFGTLLLSAAAVLRNNR